MAAPIMTDETNSGSHNISEASMLQDGLDLIVHNQHRIQCVDNLQPWLCMYSVSLHHFTHSES